jgi:transposase
MYNSKAANLPILERQRNLAKKRLLQFLYDEVGDVFKALYDQTGLNEETIWDIQELERLRQEKGIELKIPALWHQLNKWGLSFKKNSARQRAGARRRALGQRQVARKTKGPEPPTARFS